MSKRWKALAVAVSVAAATLSGIVTNFFTSKPGWVGGVSLAVLVLLSVGTQTWLATLGHGDAVGQLGAESAGSPSVAIPQQLPAVTRQFTGRTPELDMLTGFLADAGSTVGAVVISAVFGAAGIGKTTLAVHWAHQVKSQFPDGQLYVNLRGFDALHTPMSPQEALRGFLDAFEVTAERIPSSFDAQVALYRSILADKKVLVVLDNARDVEQVRPLLPGSAQSFVLITSRNHLGGLVVGEGAHQMTLDLLSHQECTGLLVRYLGTTRVSAEPAAVDELIRYSGRLPLALAIIAAQATAREQALLSDIASELREQPDLIEALDGGDPTTSVEAVFSWSYRDLPSHLALFFRLLGLHPGPEISQSAAAALVGVTSQDARASLVTLERAHLVEEHQPGRYRLHDLLRVYAEKQALAADAPADLEAARKRLFDYYLHSAFAADQQIFEYRHPITLSSPVQGANHRAFADVTEANTWLRREIGVLMACSAYAASRGDLVYAWQLPWTYGTFLHREGRWLDYAATQETALTAALQLGDRRTEARVRRNLGRPYTLLRRVHDARDQFQQSLEICRAERDAMGEALGEDALTWLDGLLGQHRDASSHAQRALQIYQGLGDTTGEARALNYLGWNEIQLGDVPLGLQHCKQALTKFASIPNEVGLADTHDSLGLGHAAAKAYPDAITHYRESARLWSELGDRFNEADVLDRLGDVYQFSNDFASARVTWGQALAILEQINHPKADDVRAKLL